MEGSLQSSAPEMWAYTWYKSPVSCSTSFCSVLFCGLLFKTHVWNFILLHRLSVRHMLTPLLYSAYQSDHDA